MRIRDEHLHAQFNPVLAINGQKSDYVKCRHCGDEKAANVSHMAKHLEQCTRYIAFRAPETSTKPSKGSFKQMTLPINILAPEAKADLDKLAAYAVYCGAKPFQLFQEPFMKQKPNLAYIPPSRYLLTHRLLDECYKETWDQLIQVLKSCEYLNVSVDESSTINRDRVINACILTEHGSFSLKYERLSKGTSSAERQAKWLGALLDDIEKEIGFDLSTINCVMTDTCATMRKFWVILSKIPRFRYSFSVPCDSHGLQLLIKDIVSLEPFATTVKKAQAIVSHFRGAHKQLALLRWHQTEIYGKEYALTLSCDTRWGRVCLTDLPQEVLDEVFQYIPQYQPFFLLAARFFYSTGAPMLYRKTVGRVSDNWPLKRISNPRAAALIKSLDLDCTGMNQEQYSELLTSCANMRNLQSLRFAMLTFLENLKLTVRSVPFKFSRLVTKVLALPSLTNLSMGDPYFSPPLSGSLTLCPALTSLTLRFFRHWRASPLPPLPHLLELTLIGPEQLYFKNPLGLSSVDVSLYSKLQCLNFRNYANWDTEDRMWTGRSKSLTRVVITNGRFDASSCFADSIRSSIEHLELQDSWFVNPGPEPKYSFPRLMEIRSSSGLNTDETHYGHEFDFLLPQLLPSLKTVILQLPRQTRVDRELSTRLQALCQVSTLRTLEIRTPHRLELYSIEQYLTSPVPFLLDLPLLDSFALTGRMYIPAAIYNDLLQRQGNLKRLQLDVLTDASRVRFPAVWPTFFGGSPTTDGEHPMLMKSSEICAPLPPSLTDLYLTCYDEEDVSTLESVWRTSGPTYQLHLRIGESDWHASDLNKPDKLEQGL